VIATAQMVVLYLAPLLALVALLLCGRYPGERVLERLRRISRRPPLRGPGALTARRPIDIRPRSLLLAASRTGRGPPLVA
jgi:hypothetical protein